MVKSYLSRSCYNAFSNLQLQSRLPGASQHHSCFAPRSHANALCHSRLQTRIAGASHQIDQRSRRFRAAQAVPIFRFLFGTGLALQSRAYFADLIFQECSKHDSFEVQTQLLRGRMSKCKFVLSLP